MNESEESGKNEKYLMDPTSDTENNKPNDDEDNDFRLV